MKIGIICYSFSGYTSWISKKLLQKISSKAYQVDLHSLEPAGRLDVTALRTALKSIPPVEEYDILILASPVHGGRIASPMAEFLEKSPSLLDKKVICLVTHFLPYSTGGEQTIRLLKSACEEKSGQVIGTENIPTLSLKRITKMDRIIHLLENTTH